MRDLVEVNSKFFMFGVLVVVAFLIAVIISVIPPAFFPVSFVLAVIALVIDIIAFSAKYYSYLFNPILKMKNRTAVIDDEEPFYMSSGENAIVVRRANAVYATSFIRIPVYRSSTEMTDEERLGFAESFARVTSISKYPIKIASQLYVIDKDEYIGRITAKLNDAQTRYNMLVNDAKTSKEMMHRVEGELTMWHNLFDSVSRAHSQAQVAYAMVSAVGGTEEEATGIAQQRAEEIAAGISTSLGVVASVVHGSEILVFIEPDHMIPPTTISEMMRRESVV